MEILPLSAARERWRTGITELIQAHEMSVLGEVDTSADEVAAILADPEVDQQTSVVAVAGDRVAGLLLLTVIAAERDVAVDAWVSPELPATRQRILMTDLMAGIGDRAAVLASRSEPDFVPPDLAAAQNRATTEAWQLAAGAYREDPLWREALTTAGLRPVRTFERLRIDHGPDVPMPPAPPGLVTRPATTDDDMRVAHLLHQESFSDHWGGEPERPFDEWLAWQQSHAGYARDLWTVAYRDDEPVAFCCASDIRAEFGVAYIPLLGVTRAARGQGIAQYLLRREFSRSASRGFPATELTVDSASLTGADRLYRSVGMLPYRFMDVWLRPIGP